MVVDLDIYNSLQAEVHALRRRVAELERSEEERKRIELALQESRQMLQLVTDNLPQAIFWKNQDLVFLGCNRQFANDLGLASPNEIVGKTDYELPSAALAAKYQADDRQVMETGVPKLNFEEQAATASHRRSLRTSKVPLRDNENRVVGVLGVYEDITEQKRNEEERAEERNLLRTLIDTLPDWIYVKDTESRFIIGNQAVAKLMGAKTPEDLVGKTDFDFYPHEFAAQYYADDQAVIRSGEPLINREEQIIDTQGNRSWILTTKAPLRDRQGMIVGLVGMGRNITDHKRAEIEHRRLQEEMIQLQATTLAELSTPLIPISDSVLVMPLIGAVDSRRAQQVLDTLLHGIATTRAKVAILDITGVSVVDTQVANGLIRAAQAVQLLGAQVVLTGIRPEVAQTLVGLGADLRGLITRSSLQSGIAYATGRG